MDTRPLFRGGVWPGDRLLPLEKVSPVEAKEVLRTKPSSQGKMTLDFSIVHLSQSTPEIRTEVHVLSGVSLKVVILAIIVQVTRRFRSQICANLSLKF